MESASLLANRLREVLLNGTWVANTNYHDQLKDLNWKQATQKVENFNTIAVLTYHINYYLAGLIQVFQGGDLEIRDKYSFDLPPITNEADWEKLRQELFQNAEAFAQHVEGFTAEKLNGPFVKEQYGNYRRNIEGVIEHCYYHLGQVVLLKKSITA